MLCTRLLILLFLIVSGLDILAQKNKMKLVANPYKPKITDPDLYGKGFNIGDTVVFFVGNCKNANLTLYAKAYNKEIPFSYATDEAPLKRVPFIKIHGNVLYNFLYRSYLDTPFVQKDFVQQTVQTNLNFLVKDKYPVQLIILHRKSNSIYFRDITDVQLQFNRYQLLNNIKTELKTKVEGMVSKYPFVKAEQLYNQKKSEVEKLQGWINSPDRAQEFIEQREKRIQNVIQQNVEQLVVNDFFDGSKHSGLIKQRLNSFSEFKKFNQAIKNPIKINKEKINETIIDSIETKIDKLMSDSSYLAKYSDKKKELQKMRSQLSQYEMKARKAKQDIRDSINKIQQEINSLKTPGGLYSFMKKNSIAKKELNSAQRLLLSVNKIGIGRSWVDYSELTVKNVSLSGVNIELNPVPFYFAFSAGNVNYRFRDFIIKDSKNPPKQYLYLFRVGIGQKEKNNFILSFYNGRKSVLDFTSSSNFSGLQKIIGISAEARFAIDENNYIIGEVAKSSYNNSVATIPVTSELISKLFNLKTQTNNAYSIKLFSQNQLTGTRITAWYKKIGENFQSFNLYPLHVNQNAWMFKANQSFLKRKIMLDAAIRKNDFVNPLAAPSFSAKTVFKSLQLSLRIPRYPFVSVGYYPSSQLSLSNNNVLTENQYNTLNGLISHSYRLKGLGMNTNSLYTRFYNNSSDSGFIYFNASSWTVNQSIFLTPLILQSSISLTEQKDIYLFSLEQQVSYDFKKKLTLTGGLKWSRMNKKENLFGLTAAMNLYLKQIGTIQFSYDKSYLPGYNSIMIPVDMGRMTFYREF